MNAKQHWTYITPDNLTKSFAKVRNKANQYPSLKPKEQPTFHEIRALGSWIYKHRASFDHKYVQGLVGHSTEKVTSDYQNGHGIQYQEVEAGLEIKGLKI